ncbi:hypothetical protein VTK73DRAFT_5314 [Phialemonium thermophilum]|uniref:PH domain-containing protein n=1 Tax=Phialemonium thermophilum TaxID=223376 RepID=A0ABR3Y7Z0_9PEZI
MEGTLLVPPDRGTIIGRALWKTRYVVIGPSRGQGELPTNFTASQGTGAGRSHMTRSSNSNPRIPTRPEHFVLSIYKAKTDSEPLQQHSVSSITECQVQPLAHRKQGPVLPTLVVSLSPDATTDKLRKRRSSRTVGLTSKDNSPTTLLFRQAVSDQEHKLHDWAGFVNSLLQQSASDRALMSPITPVSPTFINPFASRNRDVSDPHQRPPSGNANRRTALQHKSSSHTHSSRERPVTYSDSPSLHSKRSDLSSHASSMNPSYMAFQNYATMHPADLPSPATTVGEYQGEFIEGWTSAQGRSSTISSPIRARDSIGSQPAAMAPSIIDSSSPPGPRETILDRAFQLRVIPGSERKIPGEEKLSSIARFDALMREADERRKIREVEEAKQRAAENEGLKSAWDLDEDSGSDQDEAAGENDDSDTNDYIPGYEHDYDRDDDRYEVRPGAQRARSYIGGRGEYRTQRGRAPLDYDAETLMALNINRI